MMPRKIPSCDRQSSENVSSPPDDSNASKHNSSDLQLPSSLEKNASQQVNARKSDDPATAEPPNSKNSSSAINEEITLRWSDITKNGLSEKECADIMARYPIPEGCDFLQPPELNPELKSLLDEMSLMFDDRLVAKQKKIATCMVALSNVFEGVTAAILSKNNRDKLVAILNDVGCLMADVMHDNSCLRRDLILAEMKATPFVKEILASTEITEYLFGDNADETMQSAKALEGMLRGLNQSQTENSTKRKRQ